MHAGPAPALWIGGLLALGACADGPAPAPSPAGAPTAGARYFPAAAPWYQDVSNAPLDPSSDRVISFLQGAGWGTGLLRIDFSIEVLAATRETPLRTFTPSADFHEPDCDREAVPLPAGGALEGESGYRCASDGDCHLIVADWDRLKLFEMWRTDVDGSSFRGGCLAVWDMTRVYPASGRGEQCTSADAAGFPIAPLLFSADEVAGGSIDHAVRFILPNARIRRGVYVRPATHAGSPSGPDDAPAYGARLRLRRDFPLESLPAGARVVARALQRYGMLLADGGNITLTARSDRFTSAKWGGLLDTRDLSPLRPDDFGLVAGGAPIPLTYDCVRNP
jgi:serine/threonine-protein kinase